MAFWKKSEDPWDMDPKKRKKESETTWWEQDVPAEATQQESLKDVWKSLFPQKQEREVPLPDAAEKCPWCGKDMEWGMIDGGRELAVMWRNYRSVGPLGLPRPEGGKEYDLLDEGSGLRGVKTVWLCEDCGKMVLDKPKQRNGPNYTWEGGKVKLPEEDKDGVLEEK